VPEGWWAGRGSGGVERGAWLVRRAGREVVVLAGAERVGRVDRAFRGAVDAAEDHVAVGASDAAGLVGDRVARRRGRGRRRLVRRDAGRAALVAGLALGAVGVVGAVAGLVATAGGRVAVAARGALGVVGAAERVARAGVAPPAGAAVSVGGAGLGRRARARPLVAVLAGRTARVPALVGAGDAGGAVVADVAVGTGAVLAAEAGLDADARARVAIASRRAVPVVVAAVPTAIRPALAGVVVAGVATGVRTPARYT
jgi:hypothetical protein